MYKCIHTYTYTYAHIYIQIYMHLDAHAFRCNIPILKKQTRYNVWTEKCVDLYLNDQFQFTLLEKKQFVFRF